MSTPNLLPEGPFHIRTREPVDGMRRALQVCDRYDIPICVVGGGDQELATATFLSLSWELADAAAKLLDFIDNSAADFYFGEYTDDLEDTLRRAGWPDGRP